MKPYNDLVKIQIQTKTKRKTEQSSTMLNKKILPTSGIIQNLKKSMNDRELWFRKLLRDQQLYELFCLSAVVEI